VTADPSSPFSSARSSDCYAVSFPCCRSRRASSLPAPLTCVAATYTVRCGCSSIRPLLQCTLVRLPRCTLPPIAGRVCALAPCVTRSLNICSLPIGVGRTADLTIAVRAHVPWLLRSSPAKPRAPTSVPSTSGSCVLRLATDSHPDGQNRLVLPFLSYVA
jgi:hypothetical protein